ncbi:hypothetical protein [Actinomadura roseirufa]|uniref:hypothetical protein n=1 Tax=Actinomadura roseirufa TaxID=2094049 RepID=UPI0010419E4D|nr:hypothetical protein [Actinomadura roseirufa]
MVPTSDPATPDIAPSFDRADALYAEDGNGVCFLTNTQTHDIRGTLLDQGYSSWKCPAPHSDTREVFAPAHVAEPWHDAAELAATA